MLGWGNTDRKLGYFTYLKDLQPTYKEYVSIYYLP